MPNRYPNCPECGGNNWRTIPAHMLNQYMLEPFTEVYGWKKVSTGIMCYCQECGEECIYFEE